MNKGNLSHQVITESTDHFSTKEMISPNFVNNGETTVHVFFQPIPPGAQFAFDFPGILLQGTIPVTFDSETGKQNLVNVYYCTVKKDCN